jgi:ABC-2 type transport system permease protein
VYAVWSMAMIFLILFVSLLMGMAVQLPGADINIVWQGIALVLITVLFVILVVVPFALLASVGRGYLLPMSLAVVTLILANIAIALGWGDLFPWSIPGLFSQNKNLVGSAGYLVVAATGLLGWWATDQWWKKADQAR